MPLYEFSCSNCGFEFSDILKMNDRDKYIGKGCGNCCHPTSIIRIPSSGAFIINGYNEKNSYSKPSTNRK